MNQLAVQESPVNSILEIFNFDSTPVRTVSVQGEPWFVATDIAMALEYAEAKDLARNLEDYEKGRQIVPTLGGAQEMLVINESGVYSAVMKSRKPEAKRFKRWVSEVLLPGIRKKEFVHVSEMQISGNVLANLAASYDSLKTDMEELKNAFRSSQQPAILAIAKEAVPLLPGKMSKLEIKKRGLMTCPELAKRIGISSSRMVAIFSAMEFHERKSNAYVAQNKALGYFEIVGEVTEKGGSKRKKHLWKESVIGKIPKEFLLSARK